MPEIEIAQPAWLSGPEINGVEARAVREVLLAPVLQQQSESSLPFKTGPKDTRALGERKQVFSFRDSVEMVVTTAVPPPLRKSF